MAEAAPQVKRLILGMWSAGAVALGGASAYRHWKLPRDHPYLSVALSDASAHLGQPVKIGFSRRAKFSANKDLAKATVSLEGSDAKLHVIAQARVEAAVSVVGDDYDLFEITGRGLKHFWHHPWEFKILAIQKFRALKLWTVDGFEGIQFFVQDTFRPGQKNSPRRGLSWETKSVLLEFPGQPMIVLRGDSNEDPKHREMRGLDYSALSAKSVEKLKLSCGAGVIAGAVVVYWATRFKFGKPAKDILRILEEKTAFKNHIDRGSKLVKKHGIFRDALINGRLVFVSKDKGESVLAVEAVKSGKLWQVLRAKVIRGNKSVPLVL